MAWHKNDKRATLIAGLLKRPLVFHRVLVDIPVQVNGKTTRLGILGALMLSQALYWQVRTTDEDGWFYKTRQDWERETGMTRREQETARKRLRLTAFWEEDNRGFPPRLHYRVDLAVLGEVLEIMLKEQAVQQAEEAESSETDQPFGTDAPKWEDEGGETDQPFGTDAPKWEGEGGETDRPFGTNAPKWEGEGNETDQPFGTNAPKWGAPIGPDAPTHLVHMRPPFGAIRAKWAEGALKELLTETTSETTSKTTSTTTRVKRARVKAPAPVAVVAAANIPDELNHALRNMGWTGSKAEVLAAWQRDPERVRAWIAYVQQHGGGAGLLRTLLREEPGYPPQPQQQLGLYMDWDAEEAEPTIAEAEKMTQGKDAMVLRASSAVRGEVELPLDVRQWWNIAVGQLRSEIPKASYDTWVAPVVLIRAEGGDGRGEQAKISLVAAVANDYARQWLDERLKRILERKLTGLAGKAVTVDFVVQEAIS